MSDITITITPSFEKISRSFAGLNINEKMHKIIEEFALLVERYSKQVTPVDTGRLRASIGTGFLISAGIGQGGVAIVAPHTEYAGFVHEGTRKMRGRPFMRWGVEFASQRMNGEDIALRLDREIREHLSKL